MGPAVPLAIRFVSWLSSLHDNLLGGEAGKVINGLGGFLLMLLSVYLGLFNLLPLPALDGGRLVFLTYELVTRRRANPKIEAMTHMGGIMVLGVVMILVTLRDCHVL